MEEKIKVKRDNLIFVALTVLQKDTAVLVSKADFTTMPTESAAGNLDRLRQEAMSQILDIIEISEGEIMK